MNRFIKIFMSVIFSLTLSQTIYAQDNNKEILTDTISVSGICGMCEERIENAALINGVKKVEWTQENHTLVVVYRSDKVTIEEIGAAIAEAGHDNEIIKSTDEQYDDVHSCCKYRDDHSH